MDLVPGHWETEDPLSSARKRTGATSVTSSSPMASYFLKADSVRFAFVDGLFVNPKDMAGRFGVRVKMDYSDDAVMLVSAQDKKDRKFRDKVEFYPLQAVHDAIVEAVAMDLQLHPEDPVDPMEDFDWTTFLEEVADAREKDLKGQIALVDAEMRQLQGQKRSLEADVEELASPIEPPKKKARTDLAQ